MEDHLADRKVILGIGNQLRGDDGAGSILAARLTGADWICFDGATLPENYVGPIRRLKPALILVIDACQMSIPPGEFRRIALSAISEECCFNTHSAPVTDLIRYLEQYAGPVVFIGIQPLLTEFGDELSKDVNDGLIKLEKIIKNCEYNTIPYV